MTQSIAPKSLREAQPILVVDDSLDDYEATKRAFSKANLANAIRHARSGEVALAYLRSR
jgi:two-component system response regulator